MYRLATNGDKADGAWGLQFETVNKVILMLTTAIPDNGLSSYRVYTVRPPRRTQHHRLSQQQLSFLFVCAVY